MTLINKLQIDRFRGIRDLSIARLSLINLIVGNNNCGKTSLLEAIQLLWKPGSLTNIKKLVRMRDDKRSFNPSSCYDSTISIFSKDGEDLKIQLACEYDGNSVSYTFLGKESKELSNVPELSDNNNGETGETTGNIPINVFNGKFSCTLNARLFSELNNVRLDNLSCVLKDEGVMKELIKVHYVSPFESRKESKLERIIKRYKDSCLQALQLFDPNIEDMKISSSNDNRSMEYLKHKQLGNMPLSSYGDGIKKTLALFNAIIGAENGVLLIDEIETSIHMQYYDDIFRFLVDACKEFNVQAFITTHSIEAVDGLLNTQDYENQEAEDDIMVITLKHTNDKTRSSVLPGREVFEDRRDFGFEVRL